jgi:electron transfer flavoprotein alpha subunit
MIKKVLFFAEQRNGELKKSSFEAAKFASELAGKYSAEAEGVIIGNDINDLEMLGGYGIGKVVHLKNPDLENYSSSAYSELLAEYAGETNADTVILSNTAMGKDLAPSLSVKLNAGLAIDCIEFQYEGEELIATRPIYAGKALIDIKVTSSIRVFTLRPNVFNPGEPGDSKAEVVVKEVGDPNLSSRVSDLKKSDGKLDVAEADIIVSGGRGLKGPEHFHLIEDLADAFGGAQGASRAVVDAGWRPHSEQVGQTGKTVSPTLYVAVGISGAIQHLAGMRSSKYIVAINKDKDAPIFQVADYGIAGDAFEIVPALIDEIKKIKS